MSSPAIFIEKPPVLWGMRNEKSGTRNCGGNPYGFLINQIPQGFAPEFLIPHSSFLIPNS
jgi:hypothetical protein